MGKSLKFDRVAGFDYLSAYEVLEKLVDRFGALDVHAAVNEIDQNAKCKHIATQGREGETGSWCLECGEKVLEVETRVCRDCAHFQQFEFLLQPLVNVPPYCKKKQMSVMENLHVTYHIAEGTCFEEKP